MSKADYLNATIWGASVIAAYGFGYWLATPYSAWGGWPDWLVVAFGFVSFAAGVALLFVGWATLTAGLTVP
jgi:hypothetical protein